ncbi:MAG: dienelactone hydrolase family protein [Acidobacteria bacterium]|nr:dienelactone hydrolase family protein [Acidobacteriota bacterium]MCA1636063.1 dienelactone hydrolase family protein [Acidobacteriota bacterium]
MITIKSSDGGEFGGYLSQPASGRGAGLVLLQEIFGVNQVMRDTADWYAARGFVVICPDLFWRQQPGIELTDKSQEDWQRAFALYQGLDEAKAVEDAAAALKFSREHPSCDGRVGAVGYCLGGKLAYLLAARFPVDCAVGYYGVGIDGALDEATNIRSPVMLHVGGRDKFCPPEAQVKIHAALDSHPSVTLYDYPEQDHAFARVGGEHYDARAAELANLRTVEFFARHLLGAASSVAQPNLAELWDEHVKYEFATRDTEDTLRTMVEDAYVNHVPVLTGGVGQGELREFYSRRFIPQMPPDTSMTPISRTVGAERVVDEMVFEFTHTIEMDWMLPGVAPTGKHVRVPLIVVIHFRDGRLAHEHIYWDQASVLAQLGLIDAESLPVVGVESAEKVLDHKLPANRLIARADERKR